MKKIRVLVVDDSVVVRRVITDALSADPMIEVVGTASNGRLALPKVALLRPDAITLDIEMPEMDGLSTLPHIRRIDPRVPIIIFSTMSKPGASATFDALAAGATDFCTKPTQIGGLAEGVAMVRAELLPKIKALCGRVGARPSSLPGATLRPPTSAPIRRALSAPSGRHAFAPAAAEASMPFVRAVPASGLRASRATAAPGAAGPAARVEAVVVAVSPAVPPHCARCGTSCRRRCACRCSSCSTCRPCSRPCWPSA